jgi:hypothetical protein
VYRFCRWLTSYFLPSEIPRVKKCFFPLEKPMQIRPSRVLEVAGSAGASQRSKFNFLVRWHRNRPNKEKKKRNWTELFIDFIFFSVQTGISLRFYTGLKMWIIEAEGFYSRYQTSKPMNKKKKNINRLQVSAYIFCVQTESSGPSGCELHRYSR